MDIPTDAERSILLVVHTGREVANDVAERVEKTLLQHGIALRVLSPEAVEQGSPNPAGSSAPGLVLGEQHSSPNPAGSSAPGLVLGEQHSSPNPAGGAELVLVLGGDGTFLRAAELARNAGIPVLGINLGRIGFLAEAEADAIDEVLQRVIRRDYRVESRMTLDVAVRHNGEIIDRGWALNEASLEKGTRLGVLGVVVEIDGRPVSTFGCDGVLVSSPTGSTAYAFSAGGPVLWPDLEAILVVPNNAHALFARPMVTSPAAMIAIEVEAPGHDAMVFCDGHRDMVVPAGARLEVCRSATSVLWVRLDSAPFTDRLVEKFRLPVTGWRAQ
ncbi:NAD kinase [Mycolicibacterium insubricum]|nr:NAD kinase [Mycolicibacterium insubricum]MCB9441878.1 NAD kinase [Mycolicibacterium sp.]MCV7083351.1 NAD kinase [Mycolicibacterium insubricum]BBZ67487.1 NAD kinase [Mycolicibacterium insubricum]